jgi:hypothetical protein
MFMKSRLPRLRKGVITPGRVIRERDTPARPAFRFPLTSDGKFVPAADDTKPLDP